MRSSILRKARRQLRKLDAKLYEAEVGEDRARLDIIAISPPVKVPFDELPPEIQMKVKNAG